MKTSPNHIRTWVEIDSKAAKRNYDAFRRLLNHGSANRRRVQLWSVVKSNAYGHNVFAFSKLMARFGIDGLCVDSITEALALRREGIKKPILVLGFTLPSRYADAATHKIIVSISNFEALRALATARHIPDFHIKIDTGMHRQGFYLRDIPKVIALLAARNSRLGKHCKGLFTHFAAAKNRRDTAYTDEQLKKYEAALALFEKAGFTKLLRHASATGGALLGPRYHLDAVRVGIGMYGVWPSEELRKQLSKKMPLHPVLAWRTVVSEVKSIKKGDSIGYDRTEAAPRTGKIAVLPIGYWHGLSRSLSSTGAVLINGARAKILGRVSMDMAVVFLPQSANVGDVATIIGRDGKAVIGAEELAEKSGTTAYEFLTRLNPLMERMVK
ncbi:MAG TPA: alanine racemase [Candidatus Paceibacterota bacterium]|nr:alanine racemase [Candidatus Paceibacterota bacterium]